MHSNKQTKTKLLLLSLVTSMAIVTGCGGGAGSNSDDESSYRGSKNYDTPGIHRSKTPRIQSSTFKAGFGQLKGYTTLNSIGIEWEMKGNSGTGAKCDVYYKKKGASSWKNGLPLYRINYAPPKPVKGKTKYFNGFAGSIFYLEPGTTYDVKLAYHDESTGDHAEVVTLKTKSIPKNAHPTATYYVAPGNGGGSGTQNDPYLGINEAQHHAKSGATFVLTEGTYSSFKHGEIWLNTSGEEGKWITWKAAKNAQVIFDASARIDGSYIWIEGIHFRGHKGVKKEYGIRSTDVAPERIVLKNNTFTDLYHSIDVTHGGRAWVITDNTIVGDQDIVNTPNGTKSFDGEGIELNFTGGHTVAYNSISHTADGISGALENVDIFNNDIFDLTDDGIEPDYGYANIRVWKNRINNVRHYGLSFQPMNSGPWYFMNNQVSSESTLKLREVSRVLLVNNIFVGWEQTVQTAPLGDEGLQSFDSYNNIYVSANHSRVWEQYYYNSVPNTEWKVNLDYDGFDWGNSQHAFFWGRKNDVAQKFETLEDFQNATGLETHAVELHRSECFKNFNIKKSPTPTSRSYLELKSGCPAIDAGKALPNIASNYRGSAPDLGPYEQGMPLPHYGPRK